MPYLTSIEHKTESRFTDRGSRFLGILFPCPDIGTFERMLVKRKIEYPEATHHCYAWRILDGSLGEFASDDGEPAGTAGKPILNRIKSHELINAGLIVTRYFGGTKLGKPGLIKAYGNCAEACLDQSDPVTLSPVFAAQISFPYSETSYMESVFYRYKIRIFNSSFGTVVTHELYCPAESFPDFIKEVEASENKNITIIPDYERHFVKM